MAKLHLKKRVPYTPKQMILLVEDVEKYPEFLNFIAAVRKLSHEDITKDKAVFTADVAIQYKFVSETFRSEVSVDRDLGTLNIKRAGHGGAVRTLRNTWKFIEQDDGSTLIDLFLEVTLKAAPLEFMFKRKFESITRQTMNAFIARAKQKYGEAS